MKWFNKRGHKKYSFDHAWPQIKGDVTKEVVI